MLSKSKIVRGLQCHKSLWLNKHQKDLREVSDNQQYIFDTGSEVGLLAQKLYPNGIAACDILEYPSFQTEKKTKGLVNFGTEAIFEATFIHQNVLVAVDILVKTNEGWSAFEVKSTNGVKDQHIVDAAIQYWVMTGAGINLEKMSITTLNKEYVKQGDLEVEELFVSTDITEDVLELQAKMPDLVAELIAVQDVKVCPEVEIGEHCSSPYNCDFKSHCWADVPDYSVFNLTNARGKQWELYERGIEKIEDIPMDFDLGDNQRIQVEAELTGKDFINVDGVRSFLSNIEYPVYHFDFETFMSAVPMFDKARTYQQIPFQYSVHVQDGPNAVANHKEYLAEHDGHIDPREDLIKAMLKDLGNKGTILAYHSSFEVSRINELARDFPQYKEQLLDLVPRVVDLEIPFRRKYYYKKEMQGRSSIKLVLPALVPELSYGDLEIQDGTTASHTFLGMMHNDFTGDATIIRNNLLEYCKLDTYAMVELLKKLYEV